LTLPATITHSGRDCWPLGFPTQATLACRLRSAAQRRRAHLSAETIGCVSGLDGRWPSNQTPILIESARKWVVTVSANRVIGADLEPAWGPWRRSDGRPSAPSV
jgi:hypothetical protein